MKSVDFSRLFSPLYVILAGVLGGAINILIFSPFFQEECKEGDQLFFCGQGFSVWFVLITILWMMMTIFFVPGWQIFIWLFNKHIEEKSIQHRGREIVKLVFISVIAAFSSFMVDRTLGFMYPGATDQWVVALTPRLQTITYILDISFFLVLLPYALGMFLINFIVHESATTIQNVSRINKSQPIAIINQMLAYSTLLHRLLIVSGLLLGMIPIAAAALRAYLVTVNPDLDKLLPVTATIFWGVGFTLLLLIFYFPARFGLSIVGGQLRDILFPLSSLHTFRDTLDKRHAFDDLLHIRFDISTALSSDILALAPLISSLLGFLGIKL